MPAYNFQRQFVKPILEGDKPHTIRRRRKRPTKVGDVLYMYTGLRTKKARRFAEAVCTFIQPVVLHPWGMEVWMLNPDHEYEIVCEMDNVGEFAKADGFESAVDFFDFFKRYKQDRLDDFEIIYWDPETLKPVEVSNG